MPSYNIYRSRTGSNIRLEIGTHSYGFTPSEWKLFTATVQNALPSSPDAADENGEPNPQDDEEVLGDET